MHREDHVRGELGLDALAYLRVLDHRHPDRVAGHVAEVIAALREAGRDRAMDVVRGRTRPERRLRDRVVLLVRLEHPLHLAARRAEGARDLDPVAARPGDLERRDRELAEDRVVARDRELGADEHHVHRQPPAAALDEEPLGRREHLGRVAAGRPGVAEGVEARDVDLHALAHRRELGLGLDRAREVELLVPGDELGGFGEGGVVAHRHHVVEPVRADPLTAQPLGQPLPRPVGEDLLGDLGVAVLADVARLGREDDRRLALAREKDVRVAVDDLEAGEIGDGALEARVLGAADERRVEPVALEPLAHPRVPGGQLCVHDASTPFTSAWIAALSGVATPRSRPKRTMPPLR